MLRGHPPSSHEDPQQCVDLGQEPLKDTVHGIAAPDPLVPSPLWGFGVQSSGLPPGQQPGFDGLGQYEIKEAASRRLHRGPCEETPKPAS